MRRSLSLTLLSFVLVVIMVSAPSAITPTQADGVLRGASACPQIVQRALDITEQSCGGAGRNQACYGHTNLDAQPQPDVSRFAFTQAGDMVDVVEMRSLRLGQMDETAGTWGIALLRLQASIPAASPENVTMVLFGDVAIENTATALPTLDVQNAIRQNVNVRSYPSGNGRVLAAVAPGTVLTANGRLADDSWLRVVLPDAGETGWVFASLMDINGSLSALEAVAAEADPYGPMQAFTFESGLDDAPCAEAPHSGLIIQTPHGVGKLTFLINEIDVQLGSTVFFQAAAGDRLAVRVVEGSARVTAQGVTHTAYAGTGLDVPLAADGSPAGPPSVPAPYDKRDVAALPVGLLPRAIDIHAPLTPAEFDAIYAPPADDPATDEAGVPAETPDGTEPGEMPTGPVPGAEAGSASANGGNNGRQPGELPPGLVDNPGLGENLPPGHGGEPPGQAKKNK